MSIQYQYNLSGSGRKALVEAVCGILGKPPVYQKAPSFAYVIDTFVIDRNGTLSCPDNADPETIRNLINRLKASGYIPEPAGEGRRLVVEVPRAGFDEQAFENLENLITSKRKLFMKAFKTDTLELVITEDTIRFPWFILHGLEGESDAYNHLVTALCRMAKKQKRVTASEPKNNNDKFTMRLFLVRLGLIGDEYKTTRKILLMNLTGNSSWKNGRPPERGRETAPAAETHRTTGGGTAYEK